MSKIESKIAATLVHCGTNLEKNAFLLHQVSQLQNRDGDVLDGHVNEKVADLKSQVASIIVKTGIKVAFKVYLRTD